MMHFIAFFITVSVLVMFLASKQKSVTDKYGIASTVLFVLVSVAGTIMLHGTLMFPAAAFALSLLLCVHHIIASFNVEEIPSHFTLFQGKSDTAYHETWIVAALVAGIVSVFKL